MDVKLLCVLTLFNIITLLANIWLLFNSQKILDEVKKSD